MFGKRIFSSLLSGKISQVKVIANKFQFFHAVAHNPNRGIFYVKLQDSKRAVLQYKLDAKIMDLLTINVPNHHRGEGLARLLAEAAFTYAIMNDYLLYLTCEYTQKYYLAIKNADMDELVVGPQHVLEGPYSETPNPDAVYELPDPEEFMISSSET